MTVRFHPNHFDNLSYEQRLRLICTTTHAALVDVPECDTLLEQLDELLAVVPTAPGRLALRRRWQRRRTEQAVKQTRTLVRSTRSPFANHDTRYVWELLDAFNNALLQFEITLQHDQADLYHAVDGHVTGFVLETAAALTNRNNVDIAVEHLRDDFDPRLAKLVETYLASGRHTLLADAIDAAEAALELIDTKRP